MQNHLFFGIIGCGRISERHAAAMRPYGNIAAVCDVSAEAAETSGRAHGCAWYASIDEMLNEHPEISVVAVCSPNGFHAEHAIKSMQAGKHVICEKPLCIDARAGRQMIETATLTGKKLWVVKATRFYPQVMALKKALDAGHLGRLFSFQLNCCWNRNAAYFAHSWRGTPFPDGGILYTQFSHYIDGLLWLAGQPVRISGSRARFSQKVDPLLEDTGVANFEMNNGAIGSLHWSINATNRNEGISLLLSGGKGTVRLGGNNMNEILWQEWEEENRIIPLSATPSAATPHEIIYRQVTEFLNGHTENCEVPEAIHALQTVETIEKIYANCPLLPPS